MSVELVEVEPGKFRVKRPELRPQHSSLPMPYIISDIMPATEQVDGKFYTSKRAFRAVGRANGLTEVGNEKLNNKVVRASSTPAAKKARREAVEKAIVKVRSG